MIVKITLMGICICIISLFLKQYNSSFVIIIDIAFAVIAVIFLVNSSSESVRELKELFAINSATSKITVCLYKAGFICILSKLAGDICNECGSKVIADIIDLSGKIMLLFIALPYIESIIRTAATFVK